MCAIAASNWVAALIPSAGDCGEDVVELALVDQWADLGLRVARVADYSAAQAFEQAFAEVCVNRLVDVDAAGGGAFLSG